MSGTRTLADKSYRAALAASEVTGAVTLNGASLAGLLLLMSNGSANHAAQLVIPPRGTSRVFDAAHEYLVRVLDEERGAIDTQRQTG